MKTDLEAAMIELDKIMRANELTVAVTAALPAMLIAGTLVYAAYRTIMPPPPNVRTAAGPARVAMAELEQVLPQPPFLTLVALSTILAELLWCVLVCFSFVPFVWSSILCSRALLWTTAGCVTRTHFRQGSSLQDEPHAARCCTAAFSSLGSAEMEANLCSACPPN
jgi:hypothetical protein